MRINAYESAVILNAALDDDQINSEINRIKETITNNGGEITDVDNWGRKRLAYVVNKSKIGNYVIFRFSAPSPAIAKLERYYTLNEYILRFLTIKLDKFAIEYLEKAKTAKAAELVVEDKPADVQGEGEAVNNKKIE